MAYICALARPGYALSSEVKGVVLLSMVNDGSLFIEVKRLFKNYTEHETTKMRQIFGLKAEYASVE